MQRFIGRLAGIGMLVVALLASSAVALADGGTSRYVNLAGGVAGCPAPAGKTYNTIQDAVNTDHPQLWGGEAAPTHDRSGPDE
jgi:hypothetical protein